MSKNGLNFKKTDVEIEYPAHESAKVVIVDNNFPIKDILVGITYPFPTYSIKRRATGKYYLLEYVLSGSGKMESDGKDFDIKKGDVIFYDKDSDQNYRSDKISPLKKIWINFSCDYFKSVLNAYGVKSGVYSADCGEYFEQIFSCAQGENPSVPFVIAEKLNSIILAIAKSNLRSTKSSALSIRSAILGYVYKKLNLKEISKELHLSESTVIRTFKKEYQTTPYKFLLCEKLKTAKTLLKTTKMSVKEISYILCFTDEHYFSYSYKRYYGCSPSQSRV